TGPGQDLASSRKRRAVMAASTTQTRWLWADLETTGLGFDANNPQQGIDDVILEVAALVTDTKLNVLGSFGPQAVTAGGAHLALMDDYVRDMHTGTGLLERVAAPDAVPIKQVDKVMSSWL